MDNSDNETVKPAVDKIERKKRGKKRVTRRSAPIVESEDKDESPRVADHNISVRLSSLPSLVSN